MRKFPNNLAMLNKVGNPEQGLVADSKYYNFVMARKILFFITFFSRYLISLYNVFREKKTNVKFKKRRF